MPSKGDMDRIKALTELLERLNEPIAERLKARLAPHLRRGEELPDMELIQRLIGRLAAARLRALIETDEAEGRE